MKLYLIIVIICFCLFNKAYGQSATAAIDSLIKYRVITDEQRPIMRDALKDLKGRGSYRVAILSGLQNIIIQKTFHIDPRKIGLSYSYSVSLGKKNQDSTNTSLHALLEKIK